MNHIGSTHANSKIELDRIELNGAVVTAEVQIRNQSGSAWRSSEGFALGYHLFDADSGTLLVDGARVHSERDLEPGDSAHFYGK